MIPIWEYCKLQNKNLTMEKIYSSKEKNIRNLKGRTFTALDLQQKYVYCLSVQTYKIRIDQNFEGYVLYIVTLFRIQSCIQSCCMQYP